MADRHTSLRGISRFLSAPDIRPLPRPAISRRIGEMTGRQGQRPNSWAGRHGAMALVALTTSETVPLPVPPGIGMSSAVTYGAAALPITTRGMQACCAWPWTLRKMKYIGHAELSAGSGERVDVIADRSSTLRMYKSTAISHIGHQLTRTDGVPAEGLPETFLGSIWEVTGNLVGGNLRCDAGTKSLPTGFHGRHQPPQEGKHATVIPAQLDAREAHYLQLTSCAES